MPSAQMFCNEIKRRIALRASELRGELSSAINRAASLEEMAQAMENFGAKYNGQTVGLEMVVWNRKVASMKEVAEFTSKEMVANVDSDAASAIYYSNLAAIPVWVSMVKPRGDWDHKPFIRKKYNYWSYDSQSKLLFSFDIWS